MANIFGTTNPFYNSSNIANTTNISVDERLAMLNQKLGSQGQPKQQEQTNGRFGQLVDFVKSLPPNNAEWTSKQTDVQEKINIMMSVFLSEFLFENTKSQFEEWCNKNSKQCINEYVDTFINTSNDYVDKTDVQEQKISAQEQEILALKSQMAQMAQMFNANNANKKGGEKV